MNLDRLKTLREKRAKLKEQQDVLQNEMVGTVLKDAKKTKVEIEKYLTARRRKLISQLMQIYPIERTAANNNYSVRGIVLPVSGLTSYEEQPISSALGYIAHLVFLLSKYLDVPLRYRIVYRCSRSGICDDVESFTELPLYFQNTNLRNFEKAIRLLHRNIAHVSLICVLFFVSFQFSFAFRISYSHIYLSICYMQFGEFHSIPFFSLLTPLLSLTSTQLVITREVTLTKGHVSSSLLHNLETLLKFEVP